jgi:hypothetical protein
MSEDFASPKRSRKPLWILIVLCVAPIAASYIAFYWWQPDDHVNYGQLLSPKSMPDAGWSHLDGTPARLADFGGKWVLTIVDAGDCDAWCRDKLAYIRQIRLAQGREADRVARLWIVTNGVPDRTLLADHAGLELWRPTGVTLASLFPAERSLEDHIYVIDPLGNLMMRYERDADPRRMLKDVTRLLRHSKWR